MFISRFLNVNSKIDSDLEMYNTYSCFTNGSFSKFIEINEEFLDSNSIFCYKSL